MIDGGKKMNLKDVIEVLTQYEVRRTQLNHNPQNNMRTYGLCCPDTRIILLEQQQDHMELRDSIIHEFLHASAYIKGTVGTNCREHEKMVRKESKYLMEKLYGR